ncbi:site-specific integrase [Apibacter adventoris]|uniref:Integrase n=1 Tax=Apibacter adventoris TaxID=1679466 RepID=A0A2S8AAS8_9FLAO|nr:site-specific integrase [Apibacter adventoris]PQL91664.1 integrase [Apibacter adventoris]
MEINKLNILFVIAKSRINKMGNAPLFCRLTYQEKRKQFSTGLFINPKYWQNTKQQAHPPSEHNKFINSQLSLIKNNINQAFLFLQLQSENFTVEHIYKQYAGETQNEDKSLMDIFNYHNNRMKSLVGIEASINSWERYHNTHNHIKDFIWHKFKKKDYSLRELNLNFIMDFEYYLQTEKGFMATTIFKSIQRFRRVIRVAVAMDYLLKDPFLLYRAKNPKKQIIYLTLEELSKLENYTFSQARLQQVADMFIFCCYTGLAYQEMNNLTQNNIIEHDNVLWIDMYRQKTQKQFLAPLLPKAVHIIKKYQNEQKLLPIISNQKFNSYLKEIADIVGINKNLTHHIARKTFATTVLLYNDVPMEIVSELLGHSKITITQEHYAKVVQKKVSEHIQKLSKKLSQK